MTESTLNAHQIAWASQLEQIGDEHGFYRALDPEHKALFVKGDDTLVVTFDNLDDARQKVEDRLPWGVKFINSQGWSALGVAAHGWTWYRAEAVHDFFDQLKAERFFDRFKQVVFYGASMAGYAAAAFSSAAPGAKVIALSPQATLDRDLTGGWENRFRLAWRRDFNSRYGYAPNEVRTAQKMWLFYDPLSREDAVHAALFRSPNVTRIRCRHFGHNMGSVMNLMGALKPITQGCVTDDLDEAGIYKLLRARRHLPLFQKQILQQITAKKRPLLTYHYARAVLDDSYPKARPHFLRQVNTIAKQHNLAPYAPPEN
ncbi:phosphoadenosine phosphosulfate reductase [Thioclava sp. 15-R06ZXC-3]|uniref:Phosphoadenosine phosphosulfate reductase n=1 Tax=Thioclava arctica TaxID=3238301 RepID=A0ABV3TIG5_9RHOB